MSGWQVAALIVAAWFSLCACLLCGWMAWVTLADRSHRRRRGGYVKLPASSLQSRVGTYTTGGTANSAVSFSSPGEPGPGSAGAATRPTPRGPNRPGAPTSSGSATAEAGASGAPPAAAASLDVAQFNKWRQEAADAEYPRWPTGGIVP